MKNVGIREDGGGKTKKNGQKEHEGMELNRMSEFVFLSEK